jgi:hypothetical protein
VRGLRVEVGSASLMRALMSAQASGVPVLSDSAPLADRLPTSLARLGAAPLSRLEQSFLCAVSTAPVLASEFQRKKSVAHMRGR